jgi:hypothetical protein
MAISQLINSFSAGEMSPFLDGRSDLEKYRSGCLRCENFILLPYGGVVRRPGTEFLAESKFSDRPVRLVGFSFSVTTRFVLEFGHYYVRFWSNGTPVPNPEDATQPLEVITPWAFGQLNAVKFLQINDIVYFAHPSIAPQKLTRLADNNWTLASVDFSAEGNWPVFLEENLLATTITPSATTGTGITLTASEDVFQTGHVGAYFQISHRRDNAWVEKLFDANGSTSGIVALGAWELTTYGTWAGTLLVQRSYDAGVTWETIRSFNSKSDRNVSTTGVENQACLLRLTLINRTVGTATTRGILELGEAKQSGVVRIISVESATSATADVVRDMAAITATKLWSEGAWSALRGYPSAVNIFQSRIVYAGTSYRPQSLWMSVTDDFENFRFSALDDAAISVTLAGRQTNAIRWVASKDVLAVGTSGDEWTLSGGGNPITPGNLIAKRESAYGSDATIAAEEIGDAIAFVQRGGRKLREFLLVNGNQKQGYIAPDLTILAEHITRGGIISSAIQQRPDTIYWAVTGNGELIGMTYERDQGVNGWHRHTTQGAFESVAVISGENTDDEIWVSVRRTIGGVTKRFIERLRPDFRETQDAENKPELWYVDCAVRAQGVNLSSVSVPHLAGETVDILADGAVLPSVTVTGGAAALQSPATVAIVGLPYISTLEPMRLEIGVDDGSSAGRRGRINKLLVRFLKSLGAEVTANGADWDTVFFRQPEDAMDASPPLFTGDQDILLGAGHTRENVIAIRQTLPLPCTVLALIPRWQPSGN